MLSIQGNLQELAHGSVCNGFSSRQFSPIWCSGSLRVVSSHFPGLASTRSRKNVSSHHQRSFRRPETPRIQGHLPAKSRLRETLAKRGQNWSSALLIFAPSRGGEAPYCAEVADGVREFSLSLANRRLSRGRRASLRRKPSVRETMASSASSRNRIRASIILLHLFRVRASATRFS